MCWTLVIAVIEMLDACEHHDGGGDRGSRYWWLAWLSGVPISALRKDLVMERPSGTYNAAPSYIALA
jgi:hypothetical protein